MDAMSQTFAIALLGNLYIGGSQPFEITGSGGEKDFGCHGSVQSVGIACKGLL